MNKDIFQGQWKQLKGEITRQWGKLTNDEVDEINGNVEKFTGLLQERYGYSREEAERRLDEWLAQRTARTTL